jgi:DNA invertase Pin-like site-specific DNA recombinase
MSALSGTSAGPGEGLAPNGGALAVPRGGETASGPMPRAWCYLAVSSEKQEGTLRDQRAWAEATARAKGWRVERAEEFEGIGSGKDGPRALLTKLLSALKATPATLRPQWILMIRADRVGRGRIADSQLILHAIIDLGVRIWTRLPDCELKLDTAVDQIVSAVFAGVAKIENEVRADKRNAVIAKKRAAGLPISGKRPYGIMLDPETKADVPREPQAEAVRIAFRMRADGIGAFRISQHLQQVAPPHVNSDGSTRPVRWAISRVASMLRNPAYVRTVVDEVTFLRAKRVNEERGAAQPRRAARYDWPLTTIVRCYCGKAMGSETGGKQNRSRIRYYMCRAIWTHGTHRRVRADAIEAQLLEILSDLAKSPQMVKRYRRAAAPTSPALLDRAVREVNSELARIAKDRAEVWRLHSAGMLRDEHVQARLDGLDAEHEVLAARLPELEMQRAAAVVHLGEEREVTEIVRRAGEAFGSGTIEEKRTLARAIAGHFGGLCVEEDGSLTLRRVEDPGRQRRRQASEVF